MALVVYFSALFRTAVVLVQKTPPRVRLVLAFTAGFVLAGTVALVAEAWGQTVPEDPARLTCSAHEASPRLAAAPSTSSPPHRAERWARKNVPPVRASWRATITFERLLTAVALVALLVRGRKTKRQTTVEARLLAGEKALPENTRRLLGACSVTGNTRTSNQDRVWVGCIAGVEVFVLADGLGGLPRGDEAAELVVRHAVALLRKELARALDASVEGVRTLLLSTIWGCALRLAREASKRDPIGDEIGMRTTLVLVVALPDTYVAAWVGDGNVFVLPEVGGIVRVLEPHKSSETPDLLDASLGPFSEGRPGWAVAPRNPGDVLVAATDGIADAFGDALADTLKQELDTADFDAQATAETMVTVIAEEKNEQGQFTITDNLTLALLVTEGPS